MAGQAEEPTDFLIPNEPPQEDLTESADTLSMLNHSPSPTSSDAAAAAGSCGDLHHHPEQEDQTQPSWFSAVSVSQAQERTDFLIPNEPPQEDLTESADTLPMLNHSPSPTSSDAAAAAGSCGDLHHHPEQEDQTQPSWFSAVSVSQAQERTDFLIPNEPPQEDLTESADTLPMLNHSPSPTSSDAAAAAGSCGDLHHHPEQEDQTQPSRSSAVSVSQELFIRICTSHHWPLWILTICYVALVLGNLIEAYHTDYFNKILALVLPGPLILLGCFLLYGLYKTCLCIRKKYSGQGAPERRD